MAEPVPPARRLVGLLASRCGAARGGAWQLGPTSCSGSADAAPARGKTSCSGADAAPARGKASARCSLATGCGVWAVPATGDSARMGDGPGGRDPTARLPSGVADDGRLASGSATRPADAFRTRTGPGTDLTSSVRRPSRPSRAMRSPTNRRQPSSARTSSAAPPACRMTRTLALFEAAIARSSLPVPAVNVSSSNCTCLLEICWAVIFQAAVLPTTVQVPAHTSTRPTLPLSADRWASPAATSDSSEVQTRTAVAIPACRPPHGAYPLCLAACATGRVVKRHCSAQDRLQGMQSLAPNVSLARAR